MIKLFSEFYKDLYNKSNGYIPNWPLNTEVNLGDLMLMRTGRMIKIGNIADPYFGVYEDISIEQEWTPSYEDWNISSGVNYLVRSNRLALKLDDPLLILAERNGVLIRFDYPGAYFFRTAQVCKKSILNFSQFEFKLLQQLASEKFNFKEVFVISSIAKAPTYALGLAGQEDASVAVSLDDELPSLPHNLDFLTASKSDSLVNLESMTGVEHFQIQKDSGSVFFKARKLCVSHKGREIARQYAKKNLPQEMQQYMRNIIRYAPIDILPSNDIFPSRVHDLFHFRELNLNDINLFVGEENS